MDKHTKKLLGSYQKTFFILLFLIPGVRKIIGKNEVFDRKGCCCAVKLRKECNLLEMSVG